MELESVHLILIDAWFVMLGLFLVLYVVLDGFTLGTGIVALFAGDEPHRDLMMNSLGGVWDANETWLVVFGGALFGAFPLVYGVVLSGLYIPVMLMIFALIFRGVAFEFREQSTHKRRWDLFFAFGSLVAAACQGLALGGLLSGLPVQDGGYAGGVWDWATPFSFLVAVGVVSGYALLGTTYLVIKTVGDIQDLAYRLARPSAWLTALSGLAVSVWTPIQFDYAAERWFDLPNLFYLAPFPLFGILSFVMALRAMRLRYELAPFIWSVMVFLSAFAGLAVTLYPYLIPTTVSVYEAASSANTLAFMFLGIGMLVPIMLTYNIYQYTVFRGKARRHYDSE